MYLVELYETFFYKLYVKQIMRKKKLLGIENI